MTRTRRKSLPTFAPRSKAALKAVTPEPEPVVDTPSRESRLEQAIDQLNPDYVECRDFGHAFRSFAVKEIPEQHCIEQILKCRRCTLEKIRLLDRWGGLLATHPHYPPGYLLTGFGPLSSGDRNFIRLAQIRTAQAHHAQEGDASA